MAELFNGEIVSADSRQIYKYLDIGTAKVSIEERKIVPHHLIDVAEPAEVFSLANYQELAFKEIDAIHLRGKIPIIAGGTGLYISAIVDNLSIPPCPPNEELRKNLESKDTHILVKMLAEYDIVSAQNNNLIQNRRRLIRALECCIQTNKPFSELKRMGIKKYDALLIGLSLPFEKLFIKIDARVDRRFEQGMINEVANLRTMGLSDDRLKSLGLEYRYINDYLLGHIKSEDELRKILKTKIHQFTRHQKTWFKKDKRIVWVEAEDDYTNRVSELINNFIKSLQADKESVHATA
jgi:tRNA dimethylallyltransferase